MQRNLGSGGDRAVAPVSRRRLLAPLFCLLPVAACGEALAPYNLVEGLRVLAVRADRPVVAPGETVVLDALVTTPGASHAWSFCPLVGGSDEAYRCLVDEADMQAALRAALGPQAPSLPPFDLGRQATASFRWTLDAGAHAAACAYLRGVPRPDQVPAPDCDGALEAVIRLEVSHGDERVVAIKTVTLVAAPGAGRNQNPLLGGVRATDPDAPGMPFELPAAQPVALRREVSYALGVDIPPEAAETYERVLPGGDLPEAMREVLTITWFIAGGTTRTVHTSFIDGRLSLEEAGANTWTTPSATAFAGDSAAVYLVIRDGRGGVSWTVRTVRFAE